MASSDLGTCYNVHSKKVKMVLAENVIHYNYVKKMSSPLLSLPPISLSLVYFPPRPTMESHHIHLDAALRVKNQGVETFSTPLPPHERIDILA